MKIFLITAINFISICLILASFEICFRLSMCPKCKLNNIFISSIPADEYISKLLNKENIPLTSTQHFRKDITEYKGKPVLFMGCSFTWGDGLKEEETISYKFAKLTKRTVYNRAGKGWGLAQMLYLLKRDDFYSKINEPEYLIYIFISRHLYRIDKFKMMPNCRDFQPKYKIENGTLVEEKPYFWHESWLIEKFMWQYRDKYNPYKTTDEMFDILKIYLTESKKAMEKHWINTKFIILKYPTSNHCSLYETKRWQELEDAGFIVIDAKELTKAPLWDNKYKCDGWHPKTKVWDFVLPDLIKKLQKY